MKIPKPRRLPSGSYTLQLRLGGRSVSITRATERECVQAAQLIKAEHLSDQRLRRSADAEAPTLTAAIDAYIAARSAVLSPATIRGYRAIQHNRFRAYMTTRVDRLPHQEMVNREAALVGANTVKKAWGFVASVLRSCGLTVRPVKLPQLVPPDAVWLDPDQILTFLEAIRGREAELPALLALHSLRRSELLAVEKKDVDLKRGTIRVSGSVVPGEDRQFVAKRTNKNLSSNRTVPIMIPRLREMVETAPDGLLVTGYPDTHSKQIRRLCEANSLPPCTLHKLRASFASLAYHLGLSEMETMQIGGWSDIYTMRKIYTHLAAADRFAAENKLASFYKSAAENGK